MTQLVVILDKQDIIKPGFKIPDTSELTGLTIQFKHDMTLSERNQALQNFVDNNQSVLVLNKLAIQSAVSDYVLKYLLNNNPQTQSLKQLSIQNDKINPSLDEILSDYLSTHQQLESLVVEDNHNEMTIANYPKLREAVLTHPCIKEFNRGFIDYNPNGKMVTQDPAVRKKLAENKPVSNEERLRIVQRNYKIVMQATTPNTLRDLLNTKNSAVCLSLVKYRLIELMRLNKQVKTFPDEMQAELKHIKLLIAYFTLLRTMFEIKLYREQSTRVAPRSQDDMLQRVIDQVVEPFRRDFAGQKSLDNWLNTFTTENEAINKAFKQQILPMNLPDAYKTITAGEDDALTKAKRLLIDYTKNNNAFSRFFHGHWNRHHVVEVNNIVQAIGSKQGQSIDSLEDLVFNLKLIDLQNPEGSLARRIRFIEDEIVSSDNVQSSTSRSST